MSQKTKLHKSSVNQQVAMRKLKQKGREGNYYLKYNRKSNAGVGYSFYSKHKTMKLPKPRISLGLWDKFIPLPKDLNE